LPFVLGFISALALIASVMLGWFAWQSLRSTGPDKKPAARELRGENPFARRADEEPQDKEVMDDDDLRLPPDDPEEAAGAVLVRAKTLLRRGERIAAKMRLEHIVDSYPETTGAAEARRILDQFPTP
jgi:hypothetical protein